MTARRTRMIALTCGLLLLGGALRIGPMFHDFWLDEAWSFLLVRDGMTHPVHALTRLHTDNNHPLNSLTIYFIGASEDWHLFRVPAWIAGVICIPLAGAVMHRFGKAHATYAMLLVAGSYPLTVYSAEARGYSTMLCCVLLSIWFMALWLETRDWRMCCLFWLVSIVGFLSHLTFVHAYLSILLFSALELRKTRAGLKNSLPGLATCHAVPLLFLGTLYWAFVRHVTVAGAEPTQLTTALGESITMTLGGPRAGVMGSACVFGFVVILFAGLARMRERSDGWHWLFFSGIVVVPLSLTVVWRILAPVAPPVFPRYFLTSMILFLLLAGYLLGEIQKQAGRVRVFGMASTCVALTLNALHIVRFSVEGRGRYRQALEYICDHSVRGPIHLATNSDFRTSLLLSFYAPHLSTRPQFILHKRVDQGIPETVNWFVLEVLEPGRRVPQQFRVAITHFELQHYFDFYGPSGCGWAVYKRSKRSHPPSGDPQDDDSEQSSAGANALHHHSDLQRASHGPADRGTGSGR